jgi:hypothetical protein
MTGVSEAGVYGCRGIGELHTTLRELAQSGFRIITVLDTHNGMLNVVAQRDTPYVAPAPTPAPIPELSKVLFKGLPVTVEMQLMFGRFGNVKGILAHNDGKINVTYENNRIVSWTPIIHGED